MRAVVQRVSRASVRVEETVVGEIGRGFLVYAAAAANDGDDDLRYIAEKIAHLRVFPDDTGKMNLSVTDTGGAVLLVSAFTVLADARKGRRPSFDGSAQPERAEPLLQQLEQRLMQAGIRVQTGRFRAHMHVEAVNDGPICVLLDSRRAV